MRNFRKIVDWYFNKKSLPYWSIFLLDGLIVFFSFLFTYQQFYSGQQTLSVLYELMGNIAVYLIFYYIGFRLLKTYSGILRYSSFVDLYRIGLAMLLGTSLSCGLRWLLPDSEILSYLGFREIIVASIIATLLLWLVRIFVKMLYDVSFASLNSKYAFVYGVKEGGIAIAKAIRNEKPMRFQLRGFVSDEEDTKNKVLMGVRVYSLDEGLVAQMKKEGVEALIVSPLKVQAFSNNQRLQDEIINAGIHIYVQRQEEEWAAGQSKGSSLKEISIEELLPRDEIEVDMPEVERRLTGKCILITGSAGSIGSEMVRQIASFKPSQLILVDQAETPQHDIRLMMARHWPAVSTETIVASICNAPHMEAIFRKWHPDYVFHAAAYKHVPMMEDNPSESIYNNVGGTRVIADLAVKYGVKKFVMISTDKAVNPTNVMGCSKRICEIYVQSLDKAIKDGKVSGSTQFVTTRFGNVLGSNGSVIPLFEEQIRKGGPVTVTDPRIIRYFMLIPEACKLVLEAGTKGCGGEIFVFDMGRPVKIADLAKRMIQLSGAKDVQIEYTGLRPGEKLYEELLNAEETSKPSFHDKIRIAKVREYDYEEVCKAIEQLQSVSEAFDDVATVEQMKLMVPEFKSSNSIYNQP